MQKYIYCVEKALCSSAAIYSCIYCIFISCKYRPHMERISCFESYIFRSNLCNWTSFMRIFLRNARRTRLSKLLKPNFCYSRREKSKKEFP